AGARPGVTAHEHRAALVRRVEGQEGDVAAPSVRVQAGARVGDMPAKVPEGALGCGAGRSSDASEQHEYVVGRGEAGQAAPGHLPRAWELADVEIDGPLGVDRVQVKMMEARRREHA